MHPRHFRVKTVHTPVLVLKEWGLKSRSQNYKINSSLVFPYEFVFCFVIDFLAPTRRLADGTLYMNWSLLGMWPVFLQTRPSCAKHPVYPTPPYYGAFRVVFPLLLPYIGGFRGSKDPLFDCKKHVACPVSHPACGGYRTIKTTTTSKKRRTK